MMDLVVAKLCSFLDCNKCYTEYCPQGNLPDASLDEGMIVGTVIVLLVGKTVDSSLDSSKASSEETSLDITSVTTDVFLVVVAGRQSVDETTAPEDPYVSVLTLDSTQELRSICFVLRCDIPMSLALA
eukprot:Em0023g264a